MRIPRDISGIDIAKRLKRYGYSITRQTGSHIRLTTQEGGEHHITIPNHDDLRLGTLSSILSDIADHFSRPREEIIDELFG